MKRVFFFVLALLLLFFIFQFVVTLFINEHDISYTLQNGDKSFQVEEVFKRDGKKHDYYFDITVDQHHFSFHNDSNLDKNKQVIEKIEYFESDDLFCIYPVILEKKNTKQNDILCQKGKEQYTYTALHQQNNILVDAFVQRLQQMEYQNASWDEINQPETFQDMTIFPTNLLPNSYLLVWNYRGINIIDQQSRYSFSVLDSDRYENTHSKLVGKYYLFPNYDQKHDFTEWYVIDVVDWTQEVFKMDDSVSFDSYVNGVVDGELYLTDRSNKRQIAVNPSKKSVREVGSVENDGTYYHGKWENKSIYDLIQHDMIFDDPISLKEMEDKYGNIEVKRGTQEYYFKTEDGRVYETFSEDPTRAILLFQDQNIVNWQVVDNVIYFLSDSTIYQYDDNTGLKPIAQSNEFKYNYHNIFTVYKK